MINTNRKAYLLYTFLSFILILISTIGIPFKRYEPIIVLSLSLSFGIIVLFINLKDQNKKYEEVSPSLFIYMISGLLRVLSYGLGLVLSAICIYFLNKDGDKIRFIYLLLGLIPILINIIIFLLRNKNE